MLDQIADHIREAMAPGRQMRPQSFRQWIRGIDQGAARRQACGGGPCTSRRAAA
ncbi:hypothetical protein ACIQV3_38370 [Streptomyces sp. NPDC099050]|uniref:hypothetical protein n=1 Tax=Streptomyces sp. NPDC099050 TaxID=3366100 RepID=UPI0038171E71